MSKKLSTKRTALQRLSRNMNAILVSEAKRRKFSSSHKQIACKRLKLKTDPTRLFERFRMNNDENENPGTSEDIHDINRLVNPRPKSVLKLWTPPLKAHSNAEKMFDKFQNSERNIGINNKTKLEITRRKFQSETITSSGEETTNQNYEDSHKNSDENIMICDDIPADNSCMDDQENLKIEVDCFFQEKNKISANSQQKPIKSIKIVLNTLGNTESESEKSIRTLKSTAISNIHKVVDDQANKTIFSIYDDSDIDQQLEFNVNDNLTKTSEKSLETQIIFNEDEIEAGKQDFKENSFEMKLEQMSDDIISETQLDVLSNKNENFHIKIKNNTIMNNDVSITDRRFENDGICEVSSEEISFSQKLQSSQSIIDNIVINDKNTLKMNSKIGEDYGNNDCAINTEADINNTETLEDILQRNENEDFFFSCRNENDTSLNKCVDKFNEINNEKRKYDHSSECNLSEEEACNNQKNAIIKVTSDVIRQNKKEKNITEDYNLKNDVAKDIDVLTSSLNLMHESAEIVSTCNNTESRNDGQELNDIDENKTGVIKKIDFNYSETDAVFKQNTIKISCDNEDMLNESKTTSNDPADVHEEKKSDISEMPSNDENEDMDVKHDSQKTNETFFDPLAEESQIISIHSLSSKGSQEYTNKLNTDISVGELFRPNNEIHIKREKYDDLIECSDDFYNIQMSEVIRIENEYTETRKKDVTTQPIENLGLSEKRNKNNAHISNRFQQNLPSIGTIENTIVLERPTAQPFKLDWIQKMNKDKQKLRSIIQDLNKLNNKILLARKELWPHRFESN